MAIPFNLATTKDIINRVAVEVGLTPAVSPYASEDDAITQMALLLDIACEELVLSYPWEILTRQAKIVITEEDEAEGITKFELPQDFGYLTQQTGWCLNDQTPLNGGLSPQEWNYTQATKIGQGSVNIKFRFSQGFLEVTEPLTEGTVISYEYSSLFWKAVVVEDASGALNLEPVGLDADADKYVLFDKTLVSRFLKTKWLEAAGFDTSKAQADFNQMFGFLTSKDKASQVLDQGGARGGFRYLDQGNLPDTGYGSI